MPGDGRAARAFRPTPTPPAGGVLRCGLPVFFSYRLTAAASRQCANPCCCAHRCVAPGLRAKAAGRAGRCSRSSRCISCIPAWCAATAPLPNRAKPGASARPNGESPHHIQRWLALQASLAQAHPNQGEPCARTSCRHAGNLSAKPSAPSGPCCATPTSRRTRPSAAPQKVGWTFAVCRWWPRPFPWAGATPTPRWPAQSWPTQISRTPAGWALT